MQTMENPLIEDILQTIVDSLVENSDLEKQEVECNG